MDEEDKVGKGAGSGAHLRAYLLIDGCCLLRVVLRLIEARTVVEK